MELKSQRGRQIAANRLPAGRKVEITNTIGVCTLDSSPPTLENHFSQDKTGIFFSPDSIISPNADNLQLPNSAPEHPSLAAPEEEEKQPSAQ